MKGDESAIFFDQPVGGSFRLVPLAKYGENCFNGVQTVDVPLSDFKGLDPLLSVGAFHIRIGLNEESFPAASEKKCKF